MIIIMIGMIMILIMIIMMNMNMNMINMRVNSMMNMANMIVVIVARITGTLLAFMQRYLQDFPLTSLLPPPSSPSRVRFRSLHVPPLFLLSLNSGATCNCFLIYCLLHFWLRFARSYRQWNKFLRFDF